MEQEPLVSNQLPSSQTDNSMSNSIFQAEERKLERSIKQGSFQRIVKNVGTEDAVYWFFLVSQNEE